jgi:diguanylate cyclase (GGDEF)-like protein
MKSVSTRIILCVFLSTLLTAVVVSWLSIGAIHRDVGARVERRAKGLLEERRAAMETWYTAASAQLAASSAIGSRWHAALLAQVAATGSSPDRTLEWVSDDYEWKGPDDGGSGSLALDTPPAAVLEHFDRLQVRPADAGGNRSLACLSARVDLVDASGEVVGQLRGCLSYATVIRILHGETPDLSGMRALIAEPGGQVAAAAGVGAEARRGTGIPATELLRALGRGLVRYDDATGKPLVGSVAPLARTGWILLVETERATAFAPAIAVTKQIFIVDVCIILLCSVLAYKVTRAIMQPIAALSEGAQRITEGHVNYQIPLPANNDDELGLLTRTFNDMMEKLRASQVEIEQDRIRLAEKNEELQHANEILSQLSITDGLTKLHNHRYFQDHLTREIKRVSRTKQPLSLILLDIDDFKLLNDTHGHSAGDDVLVSLAGIMNDSARESDLIARYGGEEFAILMPNTDLAGAVHLAEKIRMAVETTRLIIGDNLRPIEITISLGVALYHGNRREFFAEADRALYRAKAAGKNCVIIASRDGGEPG